METGGFNTTGPNEKPRHTGRIDPHTPTELTHWIKVLDTTHEDLLAAIAVVGPDAGAVSAYLKRGSDAEPPGVEQKPDGG